jgi:hypothetical protein
MDPQRQGKAGETLNVHRGIHRRYLGLVPFERFFILSESGEGSWKPIFLPGISVVGPAIENPGRMAVF